MKKHDLLDAINFAFMLENFITANELIKIKEKLELRLIRIKFILS